MSRLASPVHPVSPQRHSVSPSHMNNGNVGQSQHPHSPQRPMSGFSGISIPGALEETPENAAHSKYNQVVGRPISAATSRPTTGTSGTIKKQEKEDDSLSMKKNVPSFKSIMKELNEEHVRVVSELHNKIELLEAHLNAVLQSTWNMAEDNWHGDPQIPRYGALELVAKRDDSEGNDKIHEVTTDDMEKRAANSQNFKARQVWIGTKEKWEEGTKDNWDDKVILEEDNESDSEDVDVEGETNPCVFHPFGNKRLGWDVAGAFALLFDIVTVPLGAFEPPDSLALDVLDFLCLAFWTFDIIMSFLTGFVKRGKLVMSLKRIACRYLSTMFFIDTSIVGIDWGFTIYKLMNTDASGDGGNIANLVRAFRVARIYRVFKLRKLRMLWLHFKESIESEQVFLLPIVFQLVAVMLLMNHCVGCLWYLIGTVGKSAEWKNWIEKFRLEDESLEYRYFISFSWAVSNIGLGSVDIQPQNGWESVCAAICMLVGLILFLNYTANVTVGFMEVKALRGETSKDFWLLRRYLRQRQVPQQLTLRVMGYAEGPAQKQINMVSDDKVRILGLLTDQLRCELKFAVSYTALFAHPLLAQLESRPQMLQGLVSTSLDRKHFAQLDMILMQGMVAKSMLFVMSGELKFTKRLAVPKELKALMPKGGGQSTGAVLSRNDWLCEAALWVAWVHQGTTTAILPAEVIVVDVHEFAKVIELDVHLWVFYARYAAMYVESLNETETKDLTDFSKDTQKVSNIMDIVGKGKKDGKKDKDSTIGGGPLARRISTASDSGGAASDTRARKRSLIKQASQSSLF